MSRITKILVAAAATALVATAPASASPLVHGKDFVNPTCGGPNEIVVCKPPVESKPGGALRIP
jgi:hypothetical protein